ncbi:MAG TPA: hypothetical protein VFW96_12475 [Thermomicrobiales bacterium]|nr:hypothetical protein [Thermomicrobiales bacterium]
MDKGTGAAGHAVELRIEELVLHGFAPGDRAPLGAAVERELARLFAERGVPPALLGGGEIARLDAGSFTAERGVEATGARVARAVYGGLGG